MYIFIVSWIFGKARKRGEKKKMKSRFVTSEQISNYLVSPETFPNHSAQSRSYVFLFSHRFSALLGPFFQGYCNNENSCEDTFFFIPRDLLFRFIFVHARRDHSDPQTRYFFFFFFIWPSFFIFFWFFFNKHQTRCQLFHAVLPNNNKAQNCTLSFAINFHWRSGRNFRLICRDHQHQFFSSCISFKSELTHINFSWKKNLKTKKTTSGSITNFRKIVGHSRRSIFTK